MFRFEQLEIWELAFAYANEIYDLTKDFPSSEQFALTGQLRRAAVSMPTNIAEGSAGTPKEFPQFVAIAIRSALETVSLLKFAKQRAYLNETSANEFYEKAECFIRKSRRFQQSLRSSG